MQMALQLAAKAGGRTRPNPMVGAVVVRNGRVVGKGFHPRAGQPHAEIFALRRAGNKTRGATLYVSLEPCAHTGRTPACTEALRAAGIRRVVAAMIDPDKRNQGRGLRWLKKHGMKTTVGVLKKEAAQLNKIFVTWKTKGRPFVTVKAAQSLDGKIATRTGSSRWISGPAARRWVHQLRSRVDAILVGVETIVKDNPRLTCRNPFTRTQPIRVILDSQLRTPPSARVFSSRSPVVIATTSRAPRDRERKLRHKGAEIVRLPTAGGRVSIPALLKKLARREISHLMIEGGGETIASALAAGVVDRIALIVAPIVVGGREAQTAVEGVGIDSLSKSMKLKNFKVRPLGSDLLMTGDLI